MAERLRYLRRLFGGDGAPMALPNLCFALKTMVPMCFKHQMFIISPSDFGPLPLWSVWLCHVAEKTCSNWRENSGLVQQKYPVLRLIPLCPTGNAPSTVTPLVSPHEGTPFSKSLGKNRKNACWFLQSSNSDQTFFRQGGSLQPNVALRTTAARIDMLAALQPDRTSWNARGPTPSTKDFKRNRTQGGVSCFSLRRKYCSFTWVSKYLKRVPPFPPSKFHTLDHFIRSIET